LKKYNFKNCENDYNIFNYDSEVTLSTNKDLLINKDPVYTNELFDIHTIKLSDNEINDLKLELKSKLKKIINEKNINLEIDIKCENDIRLFKNELLLFKNNKLKLYPSVKIEALEKDTNIEDLKAIIKLDCNIIINKKNVNTYNIFGISFSFLF
jgi:hypothetical protein